MHGGVKGLADDLRRVDCVLMDGDAIVAGDTGKRNVDCVGAQVLRQPPALAIIVRWNGVAADHVAIAIGEDRHIEGAVVRRIGYPGHRIPIGAATRRLARKDIGGVERQRVSDRVAVQVLDKVARCGREYG